MSLSKQAGIIQPGYDPLRVANAPTIGTATAGSAQCASVTFTAPACVGGGAVSSYTVFANCGTKTASGASSPITVTGLTVGVSYTFKVMATNAYGQSYPSAASNSITATVVTCATYTTAGTYSWVAPAGVTSVAAVAIGGGGSGAATWTGSSSNGDGGGGGGLGYRNAISVTPGSSYTVVVGAAGIGASGSNGTAGSQSYFVSTCIARGGGGGAGFSGSPGTGGTYTGAGGGNGGNGGSGSGGGGGAGGYSGNGGNGGANTSSNTCGVAGSGGGGGGGSTTAVNNGGGGGGGVGFWGQGINGNPRVANYHGGSGSTIDGVQAFYINAPTNTLRPGGSGGGHPNTSGGNGGWAGAVRIVWCVGGARGTPSFPSTNVGP